MPAPIAVRAGRRVAPALAVGALITTAAVTAWPSSSLQAVPHEDASPATTVSASAPALTDAARSAQATRSNRSELRPSLSVGDEKAAMIESARERAAQIAADEAKAAKKKAKAAKKEAAARKAAELADSVIGSRYTTSAVKLRTTPSKSAKSVDIIDEAKKIKVTETVRKGYRQVVVDGKARWVTDDYLSKKKPSAEARAGISSAS